MGFSLQDKRVLLILFLVFLVSFLALKDVPTIADENTHFNQVINLIYFDQELIVAEIPAYHFLLAAFVYIFDNSSLFFMRTITTLLSILCVVSFFLLAKKIHKDKASILTSEFVFIPIIFPFFFLIYKDIFSLALVLLSFYFMLEKKHFWSGLFILGGVLIRQDNIIWMLFIWAIAYYETNAFKFSMKRILFTLKKYYFYTFNAILLLIYLIINKGAVMNQDVVLRFHRIHALVFLETENIFFLLFVFFIVFLPLNIHNFRKIKTLLVEKPKTWILIALTFLVYLVTFRVNHPYNVELHGVLFLRNSLLGLFQFWYWKILLFLPMVYSILSIAVTKLKRDSYYLLYPFTILFLSFIWLIEQRYYIVPFTFFLLFMKRPSKKLTKLSLAYYIILSVIIFYFISKEFFFL